MEKAIGFIFLLSLSSCCILPEEKENTHTYIINNNSSYDINISAYGSYLEPNPDSIPNTINYYTIIDTFISQVFVKSKDNYITKRYSETDGISVFDVNYNKAGFERWDSLVFLFNNERKITYSCTDTINYYLAHIQSCEDNYNLLNYEYSFTKKQINKKCGIIKYEYKFILSDSDYENTIPID